MMYLKQFLFSCGIFVLALVFSGCSQSELDARIMSVFRVDGVDVRLTRAGGATSNALSGMSLHEGYAIATGFDSFCYISLDADSIVKMDVSSNILVGIVSDRLLRLSVESGQVLVNVQNQAPGHELETRIGNTVITVRGTVFIAGVYEAGEAFVIVLLGSVYVNDVQLDEGYTMRVLDGAEMIYFVSPTEVSRLDDFQLEAFAAISQEELTADGFAEADDADETGLQAHEDESSDEGIETEEDFAEEYEHVHEAEPIILIEIEAVIEARQDPRNSAVLNVTAEELLEFVSRGGSMFDFNHGIAGVRNTLVDTRPGFIPELDLPFISIRISQVLSESDTTHFGIAFGTFISPETGYQMSIFAIIEANLN